MRTEQFRRPHIGYRLYGRKPRFMMRCGECTRKFVIAEKKTKHLRLLTDVVCPKCGTLITDETASLIDMYDRHKEDTRFHNASTMAFDDREEGKFKISCVMLSRVRTSNEKWPAVGKQAFRLQLRFDLNRRTAVAYIRRLRSDDETEWEALRKEWPAFRNVTLPDINTLSLLDIVLPRQIVELFCDAIGMTPPDESEEVSWEELQWMNKLRLPLETARREQYIYSLLSRNEKEVRRRKTGTIKAVARYEETLRNTSLALEAIHAQKDIRPYLAALDMGYYLEADRLPGSDKLEEVITNHQEFAQENADDLRKNLEEDIWAEDLRQARKLTNMLQRQYRKGIQHRTPEQEQALLALMAEQLKVPIDQNVSATTKKALFNTPAALENLPAYTAVFHNQDVLRNKIQERWDRIYTSKPKLRGIAEDTISKRHVSSLKTDRNLALELFKDEATLARKMTGNEDYILLRDTIDQVRQLRSAGVSIKTKGTISKVHDRASQLYRKLEAPVASFINTLDLGEQIMVQGSKYRFSYAKDPQTLFAVGEKMDICVASYWKWCITGETQIAYIQDTAGKVVGCLEIGIRIARDKKTCQRRLVQAKAPQNQRLSSNVLKALSAFCLKESIVTSTRDIPQRVASEINNALTTEQTWLSAANHTFYVPPAVVQRPQARLLVNPIMAGGNMDFEEYDEDFDLPF